MTFRFAPVLAAAACALALPASPVQADDCAPLANSSVPVVQAAARACATASSDLDKLKGAADKLVASTPETRQEAEDDYSEAKKQYAASKEALLAAKYNLVSNPDLLSADLAANDAISAFESKEKGIRIQTAIHAPKNVPDGGKRTLDGAEPDDALDKGGVTAKAAQQALSSGNPAAAEKSMDQVLAKNQNDPVALNLRAQARMAEGNRDGALTDARQALKLNPGDESNRALVTELENLSRASGKIRGVKLDFGGDRAPEGGADGGRPTDRSAGGQAPGDATYPGAAAAGAAPPAVAALIQRAQQLSGIGDFTGAMLPLREAIDLDPQRPEPWDMLADVSNKTGNFKGAIVAAEAALKLNPGDARALRAKSYAEFQLGDYRQALADAERAVQLDPGSGLGYL